MNCYICDQPAAVQCRFCWAFYCREHQGIEGHGCTSGAWARSIRWGISAPIGTDFDDIKEAFEKAQAQPTPTFRGTQLKRVIPVVQSQTIGKREVTIASVEEYEDGFIVYDRIRRVDDGAVDPENFETLMYMEAEGLWSATVDTGAEFFALSGVGGGSSVMWRGATVFSPQLPPDASVLTLSAEAIEWQRPSGDHLEVQDGPWHFEIPLT